MNRLYRDVEKIMSIVSRHFNVERGTLHPSESGEGVILRTDDTVFKCLTLLNEHNEMIRMSLKSDIDISPGLQSLHESFLARNQYILHNFLRLRSLSEAVKRFKPSRIVSFDVFMIDGYVVLRMPYVETVAYQGGYEDDVVHLLREFRGLGWISTDLTPKNIRIKQHDSQRIVFIDIGYFFVPYYEELFETTCRRAYICTRFAENPNVKDLLRSVNQDAEFEMFGNPSEHKEAYAEFRHRVEEES